MQNSSLIKWFAALTVMIFVIVAMLNFWKPGAPEMTKPVPAADQAHDFSASYQPPAPRAVKPKPESESEPDDAGRPKLPREKVEAWLAAHNRNAMSLLAAFRAMGDTNYLNEAAANFPDDPKVEWTVLAQDAFPADRRRWLDLLKQSSPDNSVANYLSAEDYFKNGQSEEAVRELVVASDKTVFDNHENELRLDSEELYAFSGKSKLEAAEMSLTAWSGDMMPMLTTFKRVGQGMAAVQKQALDAGDMETVANLYEMGATLGEQLQSGNGGNYVISQLVGIAEQNLLLSQLPQNTSYEFLDDQTPAQVLQEFKDQKKAIGQQFQDFNEVYASLTPEEMLDFTERVKDDGELEAMQWVVQQHPQSPK